MTLGYGVWRHLSHVPDAEHDKTGEAVDFKVMKESAGEVTGFLSMFAQGTRFAYSAAPKQLKKSPARRPRSDYLIVTLKRATPRSMRAWG